jgi:hypothetical protein
MDFDLDSLVSAGADALSGALGDSDWGSAVSGIVGAAGSGDWGDALSAAVGAAGGGDFGDTVSGLLGAAGSGDWAGAAQSLAGEIGGSDWGSAVSGIVGAAGSGDWGAAVTGLVGSVGGDLLPDSLSGAVGAAANGDWQGAATAALGAFGGTDGGGLTAALGGALGDLGFDAGDASGVMNLIGQGLGSNPVGALTGALGQITGIDAGNLPGSLAGAATSLGNAAGIDTGAVTQTVEGALGAVGGATGLDTDGLAQGFESAVGGMTGAGADAAPVSDMTTADDPDAPTDADTIIDPFNDDVVSGGGATVPTAPGAVDPTMGTMDQPADPGVADAGAGMTEPAPVADGSGLGAPDAGAAEPAPDVAPAPEPMSDFDTQISAADQIETSTDDMFDNL